MATASELNAQSEAARIAAAAAQNDAASKGNAAVTNNTDTDKMPRYIAVPMTPELFEAVKQNAGETPHGTYVQAMLAEQLKVTLPERKRRSKYATEEERDAARKEYAKSRQELIKELLAKHKAEIEAAAKKS